MSGITPRRVAVYCGARPGAQPDYLAAAAELGAELANRGYGLVYGGGGVGLMGAVADAVMAAEGDVLGVIPSFLEARELAHHGLTHLEVVPDMPARKRRMIEEAGAFVILPGGIGTLEELFEVYSWRQLGLHQKPIIVLDAAGYWQPLLALADQVCSQGFMSPPDRDLLQVASCVADVFRILESA